MRKNQTLIKKILIILAGILLVLMGCLFFMLQRSDENYIMEVLSLLATLIGTVFIAVELKNSAKVTCCDMLIQLNNYFHENESIMGVYEALELEFTGKNAEDAWEKVSDTDIASYCTFFENIYLLVHNKIATMENIDALFAYRFFLFMNNARIQEKYILPTSSSYTEIFELYQIWMRYRKQCGEANMTAGYENAFTDQFLKKKLYLHEFDYVKTTFQTFTSHKGTDFVIKKACMSDISDILRLQQDVTARLTDNTQYCPLSRAELVESMYLDCVFCVWQQDSLAAFSVVVNNRKSDRNLYHYFPKKPYTFREIVTFDAVAVAPAFRGHGLQTALIETAYTKMSGQPDVKYMAATVSPDNIHSLNNFLQCGFEDSMDNIQAYGGLHRKLLTKKMGPALCHPS